MKRMMILFMVFGISFQSPAHSVREHESSASIAKNCAVGLVAGAAGAALLLAKDAAFGVVIPGGPVYNGCDRILPLVLLIAATTSMTGFLGYYSQVNLLEAFTRQ